MTNRTRKWIRAGLETIIHGGCAAFIVGLTAPGIVGTLRLDYFSGNWWKMVGVSFAGNGGLRFFQWWQNNPLPLEETDPGIGVPQTIGLNPLSKVVPAPPPTNGGTK